MTSLHADFIRRECICDPICSAWVKKVYIRVFITSLMLLLIGDLGFIFFKIQDISFHTLLISVSVCVYTSTRMHQGQLGEGVQFSPFTTWVLGIKIRSSGLPAGAFMP